MLTEQNPPWAAKLGVPYFIAQNPVRLWLWSRPVKKARRLGSVLRTLPIQSVARLSASSHEISSNSPDPRGPTRFIGALSRAGEQCCMIPDAPLPQITPLLTGWSRLPSM
jgi:hypothetical protein